MIVSNAILFLIIIFLSSCGLWIYPHGLSPPGGGRGVCQTGLTKITTALGFSHAFTGLGTS